MSAQGTELGLLFAPTSGAWTDLGITPISIAGGTVKVKDEIAIEFDIVTVSPP